MQSSEPILPLVNELSKFFSELFKMRRLIWPLYVIQVAFILVSSNASAAGISVDAGLTPAEERWILRTQLRYMQRENNSTLMEQKMDRYILNTVLAYGLRRNLALMLKQPVIYQKRSMSGFASKDTGLADLSLLTKYGIYRRNTREYTFGIATTLELELPTGSDVFTSETWDVKPGLYISWRRGPWASDFNIVYTWNGFAGEGQNPGDELSLDGALAHQFSLGEKADMSLTSVLEWSYKNISPNRIKGLNVPNTGESVFYFSPGFKFTKSSSILDVLYQIPAWQEQTGAQLKQNPRLIIGMRFMF